MYVNMYAGNPTAGGTDGTLVSSMGTLTSPISAVVPAETKKVITCAVRCQDGYTADVVYITPYTRSGSSYSVGSDFIEVSEDGTNWVSDTAIMLMSVGSTNKLFYVRISGGTTGGADDTGALRCYAEVEANE